MCRKSPSISYVYKKINLTKKSILLKQLKDCPLTDAEFQFMLGVISGFSIKELSAKFHKSQSRTASWKREICEKIHAFDIANLTH